jgi:DGQHR domain-containing protein
MKAIMNKQKNTKRTAPNISEEEKLRAGHIKDIRNTMENIGFDRLSGIQGQEFVYNGRRTELDDIFIFNNLILITEYTSAKDTSTHLSGKKIIYDLIERNHRAFISFALNEPKLKSVSDYYNMYLTQYTIGQIHLRIIYCSINPVSKELKEIFANNKSVFFYDYEVMQYFKQLSFTIKKSARYEFFDFLHINVSEIGSNNPDMPSINIFRGNILPVEKSSFKEGYNVVSFYIDADSLIRRAYVLRRESWREKDACFFYQRMVSNSKIVKMRKYLSSTKRVFINNIIATISEDSCHLLGSSEEVLNFNNSGIIEGNDSHDKIEPVQIQIDDKPNIIGIVDGQHRVYAYYEGTDSYEADIAKIRHNQNLLVTAVLFPKAESDEVRRQFEATLFLEINNNQTKIKTALKQDIDLMMSPFSLTAISKNIISKLNASGPLEGLIAMHSYDKDKLKTASIISYGLAPLVKLDDSEDSDSLYKIWEHPDKHQLTYSCQFFELRQQYEDFCTSKIREIFIALKKIIPSTSWRTYDFKTKNGCLSVTFINGFLNVIRCQIKRKSCLFSEEKYFELLKAVDYESLRTYKSSQYSQMGNNIYNMYLQHFDNIDPVIINEQPNNS